VHRAVHGVRAEQAGEKQHLGQQEQPNAELAGVELLLRRIEMVRQIGIGRVDRIVRFVAVVAMVVRGGRGSGRLFGGFRSSAGGRPNQAFLAT
jgi:hypothetical protein